MFLGSATMYHYLVFKTLVGMSNKRNSGPVWNGFQYSVLKFKKTKSRFVFTMVVCIRNWLQRCSGLSVTSGGVQRWFVFKTMISLWSLCLCWCSNQRTLKMVCSMYFAYLRVGSIETIDVK